MSKRASKSKKSKKTKKGKKKSTLGTHDAALASALKKNDILEGGLFDDPEEDYNIMQEIQDSLYGVISDSSDEDSVTDYSSMSDSDDGDESDDVPSDNDSDGDKDSDSGNSGSDSSDTDDGSDSSSGSGKSGSDSSDDGDDSDKDSSDSSDSDSPDSEEERRLEKKKSKTVGKQKTKKEQTKKKTTRKTTRKSKPVTKSTKSNVYRGTYGSSPSLLRVAQEKTIFSAKRKNRSKKGSDVSKVRVGDRWINLKPIPKDMRDISLSNTLRKITEKNGESNINQIGMALFVIYAHPRYRSNDSIEKFAGKPGTFLSKAYRVRNRALRLMEGKMKAIDLKKRQKIEEIKAPSSEDDVEVYEIDSEEESDEGEDRTEELIEMIIMERWEEDYMFLARKRFTITAHRLFKDKELEVIVNVGLRFSQKIKTACTYNYWTENMIAYVIERTKF